MYAIVANGYQGICETQRQLDFLVAIYPYPKFCKCTTEEEARAWLRKNTRTFKRDYDAYGNTAVAGYARVKYYIWDNAVYYNVYTDNIGFIKVQSDENMKMDCRRNLLKIKIMNVKLDNMKIAHHAIAVRRILKVLGPFIDVDIIVPDISVYLALTKYRGRNYILTGTQADIDKRLGAVSFTVENRR